MKTWVEMTERERDVLVWVKGYGCSEPEWRDGEPWYPWMDSVKIPHFSTDRAAAMTLLDYNCTKQWNVGKSENGSHYVTILPKVGYTCGATGMNLPEAICRAFLRAKGINIE